MKLKLYLFIFLILFSFTSCSQLTLSNNYYSNISSPKTFKVNIEIEKDSKNLTTNNSTFEISNINSQSSELQKIFDDSKSNEEFIKSLSEKIIFTLDNIGFNEDVLYNEYQSRKDKNLLFTKRSEFRTPETKTILLTTPYFSSTNEFNSKNISMIFEILRLFENFDKQYDLSILFINNSTNVINSIDSNINDLLDLNLLAVIDLQFENTLNKMHVLNLSYENQISKFINEFVKYNSLNFVNLSEISNKDNFKNLSLNNIGFVKIISETNVGDLTKCANFLISVLSDLLNKPSTPTISVNDSIIRVNLNLENHNTIKNILYKIDNSEFENLHKDLIIEFKDSIDLTIKVQDLFGNESDEFSIKLF